MTYAMNFRVNLAGALALFALSACASTPEQPVADLARAEAAIEQAEQAGALEYAPIELEAARDKLAAARTAVTEDETLAAQQYAEEAALAADVASAKVRTGKAEAAVKELQDSVAALREEIARNQPREGVRQ